MLNVARELFVRLLDGYEKNPASLGVKRWKSVIVTTEDLEEFEIEMKRAEELGAIQYSRSRYGKLEARLIDPDPLYLLLGGKGPCDRLNDNISTLRYCFPNADDRTVHLLRMIEDRWTNGGDFFGLDFDAPTRNVSDFIRCIFAVLDRPASDPSDSKTYSLRHLGDPDLIDRHRNRVSKYLRSTFELSGFLTDKEVYALFGIEAEPRDLMLAGFLSVDGVDVSGFPYLSAPSEYATKLEAISEGGNILLVQNPDLFRRICRSGLALRDIAICIDEFPSRAAMNAIRKLGGACSGQIFYLGSMTSKGLDLADFISDQTGIAISSHPVPASGRDYVRFSLSLS